jgi:hypothetical protein
MRAAILIMLGRTVRRSTAEWWARKHAGAVTGGEAQRLDGPDAASLDRSFGVVTLVAGGGKRSWQQPGLIALASGNPQHRHT